MPIWESNVANSTHLCPELQLHVYLVRHGLARLPAILLLVILLETLLVLELQPCKQADNGSRVRSVNGWDKDTQHNERSDHIVPLGTGDYRFFRIDFRNEPYRKYDSKNKTVSISYLAKVLDDLFLFHRSEQGGRARAPLYLVEVLLLELVKPLTLYMWISHHHHGRRAKEKPIRVDFVPHDIYSNNMYQGVT